MITRLIDIVNNSESVIELLINNLPNIPTSFRVITKGTRPSQIKIILINNVIMMIQKLILKD